MKKLLFAALFISALYSCGSNNETTNTETTSSDTATTARNDNRADTGNAGNQADNDFAMKAADGGLLEVQLGKLALTKASSPKVKQFAQMMIDDHSKANDELMNAAKMKNITLPPNMSDKHQRKYAELAEKQGKDFDKEYMAAMVDGHEEMLDLFKDEAEKGNDADLRAWAQGKVDVVKHHLEMAKNTKDTIK